MDIRFDPAQPPWSNARSRLYAAVRHKDARDPTVTRIRPGFGSGAVQPGGRKYRELPSGTAHSRERAARERETSRAADHHRTGVTAAEEALYWPGYCELATTGSDDDTKR